MRIGSIIYYSSLSFGKVYLSSEQRTNGKMGRSFHSNDTTKKMLHKIKSPQPLIKNADVGILNPFDDYPQMHSLINIFFFFSFRTEFSVVSFFNLQKILNKTELILNVFDLQPLKDFERDSFKLTRHLLSHQIQSH